MTGNGSAKSDIGNIYSFLENYRCGIRQEFSFLTGKWADFEQWKTITRAKVFELLRYFPEEAPLEPATLEVREENGYTREEVAFIRHKASASEARFCYPIRAMLLILQLLPFMITGAFIITAGKKSWRWKMNLPC